jgi:hypothetical protein
MKSVTHLLDEYMALPSAENGVKLLVVGHEHRPILSAFRYVGHCLDQQISRNCLDRNSENLM